MSELVNGRYRRVIKDKTKCSSYLVVNQNSSGLTNIENAFQCPPIGDQDKRKFGDGTYGGSSLTKVNREVKLVQNTRGGIIVYGDELSRSPYKFVPSSVSNSSSSSSSGSSSGTNNGSANGTTNGNVGICGSVKKEPIINGLRGGVVPSALRKNRF
jgi:hypothetical protein